jgi:hypothetical protein
MEWEFAKVCNADKLDMDRIALGEIALTARLASTAAYDFRQGTSR